MKLLLDEMYPASLAEALREQGMEIATVAELGLSGRSDADVFTTAVAQGYALLTENVADFARIAGEHVIAGQHHPGVLIALSSRFSRRPTGRAALVSAVVNTTDEVLDDRVVFLHGAAR